MANLVNYLFKKSSSAFQEESQDKRDEVGTYHISYREFQKLQAKIRALFFFVVLFFVIVMVIIFIVFPYRFNQATAS